MGQRFLPWWSQICTKDKLYVIQNELYTHINTRLDANIMKCIKVKVLKLIYTRHHTLYITSNQFNYYLCVYALILSNNR